MNSTAAEKRINLHQEQTRLKDRFFSCAKELLTGAGFAQKFADEFAKDGFVVFLQRSQTNSLWKMSLELNANVLGRFQVNALGMSSLLARIKKFSITTQKAADGKKVGTSSVPLPGQTGSVRDSASAALSLIPPSRRAIA